MSELESQVPFSTPIPSCNIMERARVWTRVNMQTITQNPSIAEPSLTSLGGMQRCRGGGAYRREPRTAASLPSGVPPLNGYP